MNSLTAYLSTIDVNSADSIAKMVNPNAEVTNPQWWIAFLIVVILGIGYFLLKHYFKIAILDGRPKPYVRIIEDGKKRTVIYIQRTDVSDIDNETERLVLERMNDWEEKYPMKDLDVYNNMYLAIPGKFDAAQNYNVDVEDYKAGMRMFYSRIIKDQLMSERYKKIDFELLAKGKKACSSLIIEMTIRDLNKSVYSAGSRMLKKDKHDVEPDKNELDRSSAFYAFFPNDTEEYEYCEWQLTPQPAVSHYTCPNLVSGCPNVNVISPIYVDTCHEQNIIIHWKINGVDIPETGIKSELIVVVE